MNHEVSELLKKALTLPPEARAALAGSLLDSIDDTVDASAEEEWTKEIARRVEELDSGKVKPVRWAKVRRRISAILRPYASSKRRQANWSSYLADGPIASSTYMDGVRDLPPQAENSAPQRLKPRRKN